jgi:hypothetical protein
VLLNAVSEQLPQHRVAVNLLAGWRYLWASPVTLFGLLAVALSLFSGGRARTHTGVLECHGGFARLLLSVTPVCAHAMTLGHVVLGRDADCLERTRAHERAHVRQTEQFGALFPFAYLASSAWALLRGLHYYRDNWFERDARRCS